MLVKVRNLNIHPYKEEFRGTKYVIPPGEFVEMDEDDAEYFLSSYTPPKKDSQGRPDPLFFKKLKIEREKPREIEPDPLLCHANGSKAASSEDLAKLLAHFSHMIADKDEGGEAEVAKKNKELKKENKDLKARLERIEAFLAIQEAPNEDHLSAQ